MKALKVQQEWERPIREQGVARRLSKNSSNNVSGDHSVVLAGEIPTEFLELGPDRRVETIEDPKHPARTMFAIYKAGNVSLTHRCEFNGDVFIPKERGIGVFNRIRLPKGAAPYGSVRAMLADISELLSACIDIDPPMAKLASGFVMSSWFPEKLPVAPYLALVGMPRSGKTTMLRLLEMLCRHGILVADITPAAFYQLYEQSTPTLIIDETSTAADQRKLGHLLRSTSTPGSVALRKGASFSCYGPKAFAWTQLPHDRALITRCVVIPMHETDRTDLKRIMDPLIQSAAEHLQKQLLQLRLERFSTSVHVQHNDGLHARNRDLYEALTYPMGDDQNLGRELASLLWKQERFTREPLSVSQLAILMVLMSVAHLLKGKTLLVGDAANWANKFLADGNESIKLSPHAVGHILTTFGIQSRKRTNRGWLLEFDKSLCRSVHILIQRLPPRTPSGA